MRRISAKVLTADFCCFLLAYLCFLFFFSMNINYLHGFKEQ